MILHPHLVPPIVYNANNDSLNATFMQYWIQIN